VKRSILAVAAVVLVAASVSGATEQPPAPLATGMPAPYFETAGSGPFSLAGLELRARPLGAAAPRWARRLYWHSLRVLVALTDPRSGAMIAGEREGWNYVWPRDAAAGAIALEAAGLRPEARRVVGFLSSLDLDSARFYPDGDGVPGRPEAGDAAGWVAAAQRAVAPQDGVLGGTRGVPASTPPSSDWEGRQDYGENVTGDLLGNAIAAGAPAPEIEDRFRTARGLVREEGGDQLDSSASWAITVFPQSALRAVARQTLLPLTAESTPYGIPPMEGWTPGQVWTAPTAWSAWALVKLGEIGAADRLLAELHRAETPEGTLPERVSVDDGRPTSTTPLAWSHAFAILALRARYP
jgi:glucoamylase